MHIFREQFYKNTSGGLRLGMKKATSSRLQKLLISCEYSEMFKNTFFIEHLRFWR